MTVAAKQHQLIADLTLIEDLQERLGAIVDRARHLPSLPKTDKIDAHRVTACISAVWVTAQLDEAGRLRLHCDADSPLVRGLVVLMCELYDQATPADIVATEPVILDSIGLTRHLSATRLYGLRGVRAHICLLASKFCETAPVMLPHPTQG